MSAEPDLAQVPAPVMGPNAYDTPTDTPLKRGKWQRFVSWIWDADYYDKSPAERKLVFKLDCFLLTALTLGWWIKNVDQSNLSNAYV
ncbi:hypothetical protein I302_101447 [Kwoniella bestiolae CBS 10118]|uniref:Uncharacterized protein n=1 Tax=Kwoniella bestiolae CBS 10118 TaxID=1296100 RepID=A0AAJ8M4M6_9TREE